MMVLLMEGVGFFAESVKILNYLQNQTTDRKTDICSKQQVMLMVIKDAKVRKAIEEFKEGVKKLYGGRLKKIILYGSYARGEAKEDSDIDLAVVLEGDVIPGEEIDRMVGIITEINLKYSVLISVYPVSEEDYAKVNSPLLINLRREGIPA